MRLDRLTPEQEARLPEIRQEWIKHGQSCEPLDFDAAKAAVIRAYEVAGLKPPKLFLTANDIIECSLMAELLGKLVQDNRLNDFLEASARFDAGGPGRWVPGMPLPVRLYLKGRRYMVDESVLDEVSHDVRWGCLAAEQVGGAPRTTDVIYRTLSNAAISQLAGPSQPVQVQLNLGDQDEAFEHDLKSAVLMKVFVETSDDVYSKIVDTGSESPVNRSAGVQAVWELTEVGPLQVSLKPVPEAGRPNRSRARVWTTVPTDVQYLVSSRTYNDPLITPTTFVGDAPPTQLPDPIQVNLTQVDLLNREPKRTVDEEDSDRQVNLNLNPVRFYVRESPVTVADRSIMWKTTELVRGHLYVELEVLDNFRHKAASVAEQHLRKTAQPEDLSSKITLTQAEARVHNFLRHKVDDAIVSATSSYVRGTVYGSSVVQQRPRVGIEILNYCLTPTETDSVDVTEDLSSENYLLHNLLSQIRYQTGYQPDYSRTQESLGDLKLEIPARDRSQLWKSVWSQVRGSHDSGWLAFYAAMKEFGVEAADKLTPMMDLARSCGWWYPMEDVVILQQRHDSLKMDEQGRLHCEDGPAVTYPEREDGTRMEVYAINGVVVPKSVIDNSFTYQDIRSQQNDEVRRIMTERYGVGRYAEESGATCLDQDWVPITKGSTQMMPRALFEFDDNSRWLYGTDGSTSRCYWMRVLGTVKTCRDAHRAICGLDESLCVAQS